MQQGCGATYAYGIYCSSEHVHAAHILWPALRRWESLGVHMFDFLSDQRCFCMNIIMSGMVYHSCEDMGISELGISSNPLKGNQGIDLDACAYQDMHRFTLRMYAKLSAFEAPTSLAPRYPM